MDDIILRISRHYISGIMGILGLSATAYLLRRYFSNNEKTTNGYYIRNDELNSYQLSSIINNSSSRKITIFWNGSFNSTYILLDYLQQDYIIQPLYIERYTIRKALEKELLEKYTIEYNQSKQNTNIKCSSTVLTYLTDIARIKQTQEQEISHIADLRRMILNQYPEFHTNLLPTRFITNIEKDLPHSQKFYDAIRKLHLHSLEITGIELYEQATRFIANSPNLNISNNSNNSDNSDNINSDNKVIICYSQDSHLTSIIKKIEHDLQLNTSKCKIDLPLANLSNTTIKHLASSKFNKKIIQFLNLSLLKTIKKNK